MVRFRNLNHSRGLPVALLAKTGGGDGWPVQKSLIVHTTYFKSRPDNRKTRHCPVRDLLQVHHREDVQVQSSWVFTKELVFGKRGAGVTCRHLERQVTGPVRQLDTVGTA